MKVDVYNIKNEVVGTVELPAAVFGREWNADLVHQVVTSQEANARRPWAATKDRSQVRGGGRKPWRQKGTGRARHGSSRSPIWSGGGVTHGPLTARNYGKKVNTKVKRAALHAALSKKLIDGGIKIVDSFVLDEAKTKLVAGALKALGATKGVLIVPTADNKLIYRASRNLPKVKALVADSLNTRDVMQYAQVVIEQKALADIK